MPACVVACSSTPIMHEIYVRQCLVKSRNSKFLISFGVSVLTVLMWPYDAHNIPGDPIT